MALLTRCNHSIITIGTYGFWTAFLKDAETSETLFSAVQGRKIDYMFTSGKIKRAQINNFIPIKNDYDYPGHWIPA